MNIIEYFLHIAADNESNLQAKSSREQIFRCIGWTDSCLVICRFANKVVCNTDYLKIALLIQNVTFVRNTPLF